jgi:hypothetical protein
MIDERTRRQVQEKALLDDIELKVRPILNRPRRMAQYFVSQCFPEMLRRYKREGDPEIPIPSVGTYTSALIGPLYGYVRKAYSFGVGEKLTT